ncbi:hypothetical protein FA13DRAFT_1712276 [Coprinellus micaceus]|uniref:Uncharacterized protein n=1 Tax=Coprinellus micaceus TaxID=71717 RepID=A0A4Y7T0R2_COPMI|nr:hypothetical protein FA13DRAFT_1712276 [Coprinellus micaceus]
MSLAARYGRERSLPTIRKSSADEAGKDGIEIPTEGLKGIFGYQGHRITHQIPSARARHEFRNHQPDGHLRIRAQVPTQQSTTVRRRLHGRTSTAHWGGDEVGRAECGSGVKSMTKGKQNGKESRWRGQVNAGGSIAIAKTKARKHEPEKQSEPTTPSPRVHCVGDKGATRAFGLSGPGPTAKRSYARASTTLTEKKRTKGYSSGGRKQNENGTKGYPSSKRVKDKIASPPTPRDAAPQRLCHQEEIPRLLHPLQIDPWEAAQAHELEVQFDCLGCERAAKEGR